MTQEKHRSIEEILSAPPKRSIEEILGAAPQELPGALPPDYEQYMSSPVGMQAPVVMGAVDPNMPGATRRPTGGDVINYGTLWARESLHNIVEPTESLIEGIARTLHTAYLGTARQIDSIARQNFGVDPGLTPVAETAFGAQPPELGVSEMLPDPKQANLQESAKVIEAFEPAIGFARKMKNVAEHTIGFIRGGPGKLVGKVAQRVGAAMPGAVPAVQQAAGTAAGFGAESLVRSGDPVEAAKASVAGAAMTAFGAASQWIEPKFLAAGLSPRAASGLAKALEGLGITPVLDTQYIPKLLSNIARGQELQARLKDAMERGDTSQAEQINAEAKALDEEREDLLAQAAGNVGAMAALGAMKPTATKETKEVPRETKVEEGALPAEAKGERPVAEAAEGTKPSAPVEAREAGAMPVLKPVGKAIKAGGKVVADVFRYHSEPLIDRLEREGGTQAKAAGPMLRRVVDTQKELYGEMSNEVTPALELLRKKNAGTTWANTLQTDPTGRFGVSNLREAIEGRGAVPPEAQEAIDAAKKANLEGIGRVAEHGDPEFKATGKAQRMWTIDGLDAIQRPQGDTAREILTDAIKWKNPQVPRDDIVKMLDSLKADMDKGDWTAVERRMNQEFARVLPEMPSAIKVGGTWRWILHDRGFDYIKTAAERTAARTGVLLNMSRDELAAMTENLKGELPSSRRKVVDDVFRALHGLPRKGLLDPFSKAGTAAYYTNRVLSDIAAPLALSLSGVPNTVELATGLVPRTLGYRPYFQAWRMLFGPDGKDFQAFLEHTGAVNKALHDWSRDPQGGFMEKLRNFRQTASIASGNTFLNELQERLAAATSYVVADQMSKNQLSPQRQAKFAGLLQDAGFEASVAKAMVEGKGTPEQYMQFVRRSAAWLTGGNKLLAEGSALQSSRLASSLFRFQQYPITLSNAMLKPAARLVAAGKAGDANAGDLAARDLLKQVGFTTVSGAAMGAAAAMVQSLFSASDLPLSIWGHETGTELEDEPLEGLFELFLQGWGGPAAMALQALESPEGEKGDWLGAAAKATFPGQQLYDLGHMLPTLVGQHGTGPYKRASNPVEAALTWLQRNPGGRSAAIVAGTLGLGSMSPDDRAAIKGFYRWADKVNLLGVEPSGGGEERATWLDTMAEAAELIKGGKDPSEPLTLAFGLTEASGLSTPKRIDKIRSSLRSSRLLPRVKTPEDMENLRRTVGPDAMAILERHDELLEEMANQVQKIVK